MACAVLAKENLSTFQGHKIYCQVFDLIVRNVRDNPFRLHRLEF